MFPTVNDFVSRVVSVITKYSSKIESAPVKAYGRDIFGNRKQAKWSLKNERNACIKDIAEEASMYGYDLSEAWHGDFGKLTKNHHEPDDE